MNHHRRVDRTISFNLFVSKATLIFELQLGRGMHKLETCFVSVLLASNFLVSFSLGYATAAVSQSLPPPYPTNPFFINSFGFTTMREYVTNRNSYASKVPINGCMDMIATVYCPSGQALYTANGGTLYVPMGAVADSSST